MIEAIIFDMDGVIVDSEPLWARAYKQQLAHRGLKPPRSAQYKKFVNQHYRGRSQYHAIKMMKQFYGISGSVAALLTERLDLLFDIFDAKLQTLPGAIPLFKKLSTHYPLAVASASPRPVIDYVMKRFQLKRFFKQSISGDEFTHSKPHPEVFLQAARKLKTNPRRCLVIEDSANGVMAAHRAQMTCIGLKHPYNTRQDFIKAATIVKSLNQITLSYIQSL